MITVDTPIRDLFIIDSRVFEDDRGYFFEAYNKQKFEEFKITIDFVQDNQSKSSYGVIRGLHYQLNPKSQTKLVRVLDGTIYDIAVDIRKNSPTYGKWFGIELSSENKRQLLIPKGFAHGFSVLSDTATVLYKCDEFYAPDTEAGIIYNDPKLNIDWNIPQEKAILSKKDLALPELSAANNNFHY